MFFFLVQTEQGDIFKITMELDEDMVSKYKFVAYTYPGGVLKKVLYGEAPPRGPTPYPFIYHFFSEKAPLSYTFYWKKAPLSYTFLKINR